MGEETDEQEKEEARWAKVDDIEDEAEFGLGRDKEVKRGRGDNGGGRQGGGEARWRGCVFTAGPVISNQLWLTDGRGKVPRR